MKKVMAGITALAMAAALAGCGGGAPSTGEEPASSAAPAATQTPEMISMDDIPWSVEEGIVDGDRYMLVSYTNQSPFVITEFSLQFTQKDTVTEEQKTAFLDELQQNFEFDDALMDMFRDDPIAMHTDTTKIVEPGQTMAQDYCYYYAGLYYVKNAAHYDLVQPDIATVRYIQNNQLCTVSYDFRSGKYTMDPELQEAVQWSETPLGDRIPKPDAPVIEVGIDNESVFSFEAYGVSLDEFDAYVEQCQTLGYTVDPNSYEGHYSATSADQYEIRLSYYDSDESMDVTVNAPDEPVQPTEDVSTSTPTATAEPTPTPAASDSTVADSTAATGIRPEFQQAMDSYEAFMDEYCAFMEKYSASDGSDMSLLSDYADFMAKYADTMQDMQSWNDGTMSNEETAYYLEVQNRINEKLLDAAG